MDLSILVSSVPMLQESMATLGDTSGSTAKLPVAERSPWPSGYSDNLKYPKRTINVLSLQLA